MTKTSKKTTPKTTKKTDTPVEKQVEAPVEAPVEVPVETPFLVESSEPAPSVEEDLTQSFKNISSTLSSLLSQVKSTVNEVKKLEKRVQKELKEAKKSKKKSKNNPDKPKRPPSGFAKPSDISEELCGFLGRPIGTQMARTEVTKHVTQYIKDQELQDPTNKRHILPDTKLAKLLGYEQEKSEEVTYFNLQKFMKHHFPKSAPAVSS